MDIGTVKTRAELRPWGLYRAETQEFCPSISVDLRMYPGWISAMMYCKDSWDAD
jgi:hypothetical protein